MELVVSMESTGGSAFAKATTKGKQAVLIAAADLSTRGLPSTDSTSRHARQVTTDLRTWRSVDFSDYARGVGFEVAAGTQHTAWEFFSGQTRFVVPALALLRAMVRPNRSLFPKLFKPQSLDDICSFDSCSALGGVSMIATGLGDSRVKHQPQMVLPISWFYCFPSARQAWASVYRGATDGLLDFQLPKAIVSFRVRSRREKWVSYVTSMTTISIEAVEEPFPFASNCPRHILASARSRIPRGKNKSAPAVRPVDTGFEPLTDDEWLAIEPILRRSKGAIPTGTRDLFDALAWKLSEDRSWKEVAERLGCGQSWAATTLSRWKADGRWSEVEHRLKVMRERPPATQADSYTR